VIDRDQLRSLFFSGGNEEKRISQETLKAIFEEDDKEFEKELKERRKESRRQTWEYFKMRDERRREKFEGQVLDFIHRRRIKIGKRMVNEWFRIYGVKYAKEGFKKIQFDDFGIDGDSEDWYAYVFMMGLRIVRLR